MLHFHDDTDIYPAADARNLAGHIQFLQSQLAGEVIRPQPGADRYWLVEESGSALRDVAYYLYDTRSQLLHTLFSEFIKRPSISATQLTAKTFFQYPAQDGLQVNGFVTLPQGIELASTPLVVLVHGGPWGHVAFDYSVTAQLLTNRGYIVFQPNFRASTGYGMKYMTGANKDFGNGVVQQDIVDGVNYLLGIGIGDPDHLAIAGTSFGGFSVLTGLAYMPDLFRVGIAYLAPADFVHARNFLPGNPRTEKNDPLVKERFAALLVDTDIPGEAERLYEKSPMANLSAIKSPLLLVAGADDDRVDVHHVTDYSLKLFNQGNELALLIDADQGHGFFSDESSDGSLYLLEEFLGLEFGTYREGLHDANLERYLKKNLRLNTVVGFLGD